jgi:hypothetical protein
VVNPTNLIALPFPFFPTRTPDETLAFLKAIKPDPSTSKPDENILKQFLATHPWTANVIQKQIPFQPQSVLHRLLFTQFMLSGL